MGVVGVSENIKWSFHLWLARRFLRNMTVFKVAVLAEVTGMPPESILALHPSYRVGEKRGRIAA